jgi:hypothetical protein
MRRLAAMLCLATVACTSPPPKVPVIDLKDVEAALPSFESAGPEHCNWQNVIFVSVKQGLFVRDPQGVLASSPLLSGSYESSITLPDAARSLGVEDAGVRLYRDPSDIDGGKTRYIYRVYGDEVERLPRFDGGCM